MSFVPGLEVLILCFTCKQWFHTFYFKIIWICSASLV